jgi:hypothetical protein
MVISGADELGHADQLPPAAWCCAPDMQRIFDGLCRRRPPDDHDIDVPLIRLPTMRVETNVPRRQDSDEPGKQYRPTIAGSATSTRATTCACTRIRA